MRIAVVDGQGGGMGKAIIEALRKELGDRVEILALGTNSIATSLMLKSGAHLGATGENAIVVNAEKADIIMGAIGIIVANSMMGELTPLMAKAIGESNAKKILLPLNRCNIEVVGVGKNDTLPYLIECAVDRVREEL